MGKRSNCRLHPHQLHEESRMTTDITITIPLALTASQIIRGSPAAISESGALELARELHDLIAEVQARYVRHPILERMPSDDECDFEPVARMPSDDECAFMLADLVDAVRRGLLGFESTNQNAAVAESDWLEELLTSTDDALDARYLRLCDRIQARDPWQEPADNAQAQLQNRQNPRNRRDEVLARRAVGRLGNPA
jgi:hypothetical protein